MVAILSRNDTIVIILDAIVQDLVCAQDQLLRDRLVVQDDLLNYETQSFSVLNDLLS